MKETTTSTTTTQQRGPLQAQERVLSTLNRDGSRRWLRPRLSTGSFLRLRRAVSWFVIAVFLAVPHLRLNGKPLILLNVARREFTLFGYTFLPTDTLLLALLVVALIVSIFLVTALFGRIWCGWLCPQTVYMEFVYRPLERLFDGRPGRGGKLQHPLVPWRTVVKYAVFLLVSVVLANTFLAYFVGTEALAQWVRQSPLQHPSPFLLMAATTALMMFDFCYFREQTCILCCPYGRFQSVMLDRNSLIISYDRRRGEPRGSIKRGTSDPTPAGSAATSPNGDCVDCGLCAETCPTGIDIRDGLQMECIGCAQCIDACDAVMARLRRPRGVIRYSSQAAIEGQRMRLVRPRVVLYPVIVGILLVTFAIVFARKGAADVTVLRGFGRPFVELPDGEIANQLRIKITNRSEKPATYSVEMVEHGSARLIIPGGAITVAPGQSRVEGLSVVLPRAAFSGGICDTRLRVTDGDRFSSMVQFRLLGPSGVGSALPGTGG